MPLEKFSYLTGWSLTSFKKDLCRFQQNNIALAYAKAIRIGTLSARRKKEEAI